MNPAKHPLDCAAFILGGRSVMAVQLGVTVAAIGNWKVRGVPIEHCPAIERLTGGEVKRQQLRPTDWGDIWPELADGPAPTPAPAAQGAEQGAARA